MKLRLSGFSRFVLTFHSLSMKPTKSEFQIKILYSKYRASFIGKSKFLPDRIHSGTLLNYFIISK